MRAEKSTTTTWTYWTKKNNWCDFTLKTVTIYIDNIYGYM
jgi:hypothetical protein